MKKKLIILLSYILICFHSYSEKSISKDTIVFLSECIVANKYMYNILDSAIIHELRFFRRNCTFEIEVYSEKGRCKLSIEVLNEEMSKYYSENLFGYFKYRDCLFVISSKPIARAKRFFSKKKNYSPFIYRFYSGNLMPTVDETSWFYFYKKGKFVLDYLFDIRIKE